MIEEDGLRVTDNTPQAIVELFQKPYRVFADKAKAEGCTSVVDIACGDNMQRPYLEGAFKSVYSFDIEANPRRNVMAGNVLSIPLDNEQVDVALCLETVEHLKDHNDHLKALLELLRVSRRYVIIGSVNASGPDVYKGETIFKQRNGLNPHHFTEMDSIEFMRTFNVTNYHTQFAGMYCDNNDLDICAGIDPRKCYANYVIIDKEKPNEYV